MARHSTSSLFSDFRLVNSAASIKAIFSAHGFSRNPWDAPNQWHIWTDGITVVSSIFSIKKGWSTGPLLEVSDTYKSERIIEAGLALQASYGRHNNMGIILHVADEFSLSVVKEAFADPSNYNKTRLVIMDNPGNVISEEADSSSTWRFYPIPASKTATAIRMSSSREKGLDKASIEFSSNVICGVYSAPVEMLLALPIIFSEQPLISEDRPVSIIALIYLKFTLLVTLTNKGIINLANLSHNTAPVPRDLGGRINQALIDAGGRNSYVCLIDCAIEGNGLEKASELLKHYAEAHPEFLETVDLLAVSSQSMMENLSQKTNNSIVRPEMLINQNIALKLPGETRVSRIALEAARDSFATATLRDNQVAVTKSEAIVAFFGKLLRFTLSIGLFGYLGWASWQTYKAFQSPSWNSDQSIQQPYIAEVNRISKVLSAIQSWKVELQPRSQSWLALEVASRLFSEKDGLILRSMNYNASSNTGSQSSEKFHHTMTRKWVFEGISFESQEAILDKIDTTTVSTVFDSIAKDTGNTSFSESKTRHLNVEVRHQVMPAMTVNGKSYTLGFTITVTQEFTDNDPMIPKKPPILPPVKDAAIYQQTT